jgi:hypothetical protein
VVARTARWHRRAGTARALARSRECFAELAQKFQRLVDALNDVSEMSHTHTDSDVLRQYEIWLKTGSPRAHGILKRLGSSPPPCRLGRAPH